MKRKVPFLIWIILVVIAGLALLNPIPSDFLNQVLRLNLDPSLWFVFNALGLIPLYFIILSVNDKKPWWISSLYLLGLGLGGFVLFPLEFLFKSKPQPLKKSSFFLLGSIDIILTLMLLWAVFFGDWSVYRQAYQNDLFVYIMTWDFIALIIVLFYKVASQSHIYFSPWIKKE
jgi:hypothetical protein